MQSAPEEVKGLLSLDFESWLDMTKCDNDKRRNPKDMSCLLQSSQLACVERRSMVRVFVWTIELFS